MEPFSATRGRRGRTPVDQERYRPPVVRLERTVQGRDLTLEHLRALVDQCEDLPGNAFILLSERTSSSSFGTTWQKVTVVEARR